LGRHANAEGKGQTVLEEGLRKKNTTLREKTLRNQSGQKPHARQRNLTKQLIGETTSPCKVTAIGQEKATTLLQRAKKRRKEKGNRCQKNKKRIEDLQAELKNGKMRPKKQTKQQDHWAGKKKTNKDIKRAGKRVGTNRKVCDEFSKKERKPQMKRGIMYYRCKPGRVHRYPIFKRLAAKLAQAVENEKQ